VLVSTTTAIAGQEPIPLRVGGPEGIERVADPVTGGIPLPRGRLNDAGAVRLLDPDGHEVAVQTEALARWGDGSVKWVLLDFAARVPAGGSATYRLTGPAGKAAPAAPVVVAAGRKEVTIDTGVLKLAVSRRRCNLIDSVWMDTNDDGAYGDDERVASGIESVLRLIDVGSQDQKSGTYRTSSEDRPVVTVEATGPQRATLRIDGWHRRDDGERVFPLVARIHAYAGSTRLRVSHTFIVSEDPTTCFIGSIGLRVPLRLDDPRRATIGADPEPTPVEGDAGYLLQGDWDHYKVVRADGSVVTEGQQARGWIELGDSRVSLTMAVRDHWRQYPKELFVDRKGGVLMAYFWPEHEAPACDMRRTADQVLTPEFRKYMKTAGFAQYNEHLNRGHRRYEPATNAYGVAKTHEVMLDFQPGTRDAATRDRAVASFQEPLRPFVSPEWNAATRAVGRFHPHDPETFPAVEARQTALVESLIGHQTRWSKWYGIWDYGDFQTFPGQDRAWHGRWGWIQNELDMPQTLLLHYLRTGRSDFWRVAESSARHIADVDTRHYGPPDSGFEGLGLQRRHEVDHWSFSGHMAHTNVSGLIEFYFLTGERRFFEVATATVESQMFSDAFRWREVAREDHGRRFGNAMSCAARVYEATGEPRHRRWLDKIIDHYVYGQLEAGDWRNRDGNSEVWYTRTYLMRGFAEAYRVTGEPRIIDAVIRAMDWETRGEVMTSSAYDPADYPGVAGPALAYWVTGNVNYARKILRELPVGLDTEPGPQLLRNTHRISMGECPVYAYAMAVLHDARKNMTEHYGALSPQQRLIGQAGEGEPIRTLPNTVPAPLDISAATNADPARPFEAEPTQLDNKSLPPAAFTQLPWGQTSKFAGVPFTLGERMIVLPPGRRIRIPMNVTAKRLHVLGQVTGVQRLADTVGARYLVHYQGGETHSVELRNLRDYDYCRGPSWVQGRTRWARYWDDRLATHVNVLTLEVRPELIESLELVDVMGQQLAVVAITADVSDGR